MDVETPSKNRYVLTVIDDYSRYTTLYLIKHKSEVEEKIRSFVKEMETQYGKTVRIIRSDNGGEYTSKSLSKYYEIKGIRPQYTAPFSPQQNGVAERKNRLLIEMTRCLLLQAKLPKTYWGEAINTANELLNRMPYKHLDKTPYELWHGKKPILSDIKCFGSTAIVHQPKQSRKKLDNVDQRCLFMGYKSGSKAYRLLDTSTSKIIISRDVRFLPLDDDESRKDNQTTGKKTQASAQLPIIEFAVPQKMMKIPRKPDWKIILYAVLTE